MIHGDGIAVNYPFPVKTIYYETSIALDWPYHAGFSTSKFMIDPELGDKVKRALTD